MVLLSIFPIFSNAEVLSHCSNTSTDENWCCHELLMLINLTHLRINRNIKPERGTSHYQYEKEIPLWNFWVWTQRSCSVGFERGISKWTNSFSLTLVYCVCRCYFFSPVTNFQQSPHWDEDLSSAVFTLALTLCLHLSYP